MGISFNGFKENVITMKVESKLTPGTFVEMDGNETVAAAEGENEIIGVVLSSDDSFAAVQVSGVVTAPIASGVTGLTAGYQILTADGTDILVNDDDCSIKRLVLSVGHGKVTFML